VTPVKKLPVVAVPRTTDPAASAVFETVIVYVPAASEVSTALPEPVRTPPPENEIAIVGLGFDVMLDQAGE
jgi:hypothetical protein